jgi:hypothetical protein
MRVRGWLIALLFGASVPWLGGCAALLNPQIFTPTQKAIWESASATVCVQHGFTGADNDICRRLAANVRYGDGVHLPLGSVYQRNLVCWTYKYQQMCIPLG